MKYYWKPALVIVTLLIGYHISVFSQSKLEQSRDSLLQLIQQDPPDTTKGRLYQALILLYMHSQPETALEYAQKSLTYALKSDDHDWIIDTYGDLFNAHFYMGSPQDSLYRYTQLAEKKILDVGDSSRLMEPYWFYAMYYGNLGQADEELSYYLKALDIANQYQNNPNAKAKLYNNIGGVLASKDQLKEAEVYFRKGLSLVKLPGPRSNMLCNLADIYLKRGEKIDSAQMMYNEALEAYYEVNDVEGIIYAKIGQAEAYTFQQTYERAEQLYLECLQLGQSNNVGESLINTYTSYAQHLHRREKYEQAIYYAQKGIDMMKQRQNFYGTREVYELLHKSLAASGSYDKAYTAHLEWSTLKDSLNNVELLERVNQLETQFQVEQKETQNKLLLTEQLAAEREIRNKNFLTLGLILGLILAIGWGISIYNANQKKKKYNEQLEITVAERTAALQEANNNLEQANYELRTFNYIASHDIKEPIRNIGNFAGLIKYKIPTEYQESLNEYFEIIKNGTTQLYTLAEDFAHYTTLSRDENVDLIDTNIDTLVNNVLQNLKATIIKYKGQVVNEGIPRLKANQSLLYVALKNLIENGLKYNKSEIPTVKLQYQESPSHHKILVIDNGVGIESAYFEKIFEMFTRLNKREGHEGSGIGLAIVKLAMDKMNGKVMVESKIGEGSRFILCLPK